MLHLETIWFNTSLCLHGLFGRPFSTFLTLRCLVELCLKAELKLELLLVHVLVYSSFWCSLSAHLVSLSFSFVLCFSLSVNFIINLTFFFPEICHFCGIFLDDFEGNFCISQRWLLVPFLESYFMNS